MPAPGLFPGGAVVLGFWTRPIIGVLIKGLFQRAAGLWYPGRFFAGIMDVGASGIILGVCGADFPFESLW